MKRLKDKWDIKSDLQFTIILLVFAVTGSTSVIIRRPLMEWLNISELPGYAYWPLSIILAIICYQIMLIVNGTIVGQFKFFWAFEKKMFSRFSKKRKIEINE